MWFSRPGKTARLRPAESRPGKTARSEFAESRPEKTARLRLTESKRGRLPTSTKLAISQPEVLPHHSYMFKLMVAAIHKLEFAAIHKLVFAAIRKLVIATIHRLVVAVIHKLVVAKNQVTSQLRATDPAQHVDDLQLVAALHFCHALKSQQSH